MSINTLVTKEGKCSSCGREYHKNSAQNSELVIVCDCYKICPICGQEMESYTPDLAPKSYGLDGKCDLQILNVCNNLAGHSSHSPYYSSLKPVEVELS